MFGAESAALDTDTLLFFSEHTEALPLYAALEAWLYQNYPDTDKRVQKTQITFVNRCVYACVSFARVRRRAELPTGYLVLTLGLPEPLSSPRVAAAVEPYPGRWTHHIVLSCLEELDAELFSWIDEAYVFAAARRPRRTRTSGTC